MLYCRKQERQPSLMDSPEYERQIPELTAEEKAKCLALLILLWRNIASPEPSKPRSQSRIITRVNEKAHG